MSTLKLEDFNIRSGSNKEQVAVVFFKKGKEDAIKKALALKLQENTARSWCSFWKNNKKAKVGPHGGLQKSKKKVLNAKSKAGAKKTAPVKKVA